MSRLSDFALRHVLPILERIAPHWTEELKTNFAVNAEREHRPHPFSLFTGMDMGPPDPGATAETAKPIPPHAPGGGHALQPFQEVRFAPSGYVSWPGLADRRYTGRHLPPASPEFVSALPGKEEVVRTLLLRREGEFTPCSSTSALFCFFAQWFTDSFLRTDPIDRRRNTSNHEIDYCQIYGLDEPTTLALRERRGGRMRLDRGRLPRLTDDQGRVGHAFYDLSYIRDDTPGASQEEPGARLRAALAQSLAVAGTDARWNRMYASGLERGNSTILYTALSTMCAREHNKVAGKLARIRPDWDDDRLFETARVVMIRNVLQIVVEDYINHLAGGLDFHLDRSFAERQPWYRTNRISLEFNLLYRWHSLVPETLTIDGTAYDNGEYRFNNAVLEKHGIERCINAASTQHAGRIQLYNTPAWLWKAEMATLDMSRTFGLQPFTAYCEHFGHRPPESIEELVDGDERAVADLTRLYGTIENVELPIGLIAQARGRDDRDAVLPPMIRTMVAVDAFTHILTNPILAGHVYEAAFTGDEEDVGKLTLNTGGIAGLMTRASARGSLASPSFSVRAPLGSD